MSSLRHLSRKSAVVATGALALAVAGSRSARRPAVEPAPGTVVDAA